MRPPRLIPVALSLGIILSTGVSSPAVADEVRDRQYWLSSLGIQEAWSVTRGAGVTIAIIDTGVDGAHQDLQGVLVGGADFSGRGSPDGQTPVGQGSEHGTMVASLAAGRGHADGAGVIGSAPEASVLTISMSFLTGTLTPDEQVARAVEWAVDNGADVISLSLTRNTPEWPESWDDAFGYAERNDVVVVAAAGNRRSGTDQVGAPATMPGVLTVGGIDRQGRASMQASSQGITIGVMAPSEDLVGALPGNEYALWEGTSGATPIVAGIVALVRAAHPELDAANVINRIITTANPVTDVQPDPLYGYGIVDAFRAVTESVPAVDQNPLGTLAEWVTLYRRGEGSPTVIPLDELTEEQTVSDRAPIDFSVAPAARPLSLGTAMVGGLGLSLTLILGAGVWAWYRERRKSVD